MPGDSYDLILVGTGFANSFFLQEYLALQPASPRVLVLERGRVNSHEWQVAQRKPSDIGADSAHRTEGLSGKRWQYAIGFGGSSNCWWGGTPRQFPADFEMKTRYGVGRDWPIGYADLEDAYEVVERTMSVSGAVDGAPYPRRTPYPLPPHRFTDPDRILKSAYPDLFFQQPTARASRAVAGRNRCCANAVCQVCPVDAKFTIQNGLGHLYEDPRVTLVLEARVRAVETTGGRATGVVYAKGGAEHRATGDLIGLGANALFNAEILLRSGFTHPMIGRRLHEQASTDAIAYLDGVDNFQGSTVVTGHGSMLYDGPHRSNRGACLMEFWNRPMLRRERGKWRQLLYVYLIHEDLPLDDNRVDLAKDGSERPIARFLRRSEYAERGRDWAHDQLKEVLAPLPIERIEANRQFHNTEAHIQGTAVMGADASDSVVDDLLRMHDCPNLLVLGSSAFPTTGPANPTLTLSALSVRAARGLLSSQLVTAC